jgi:integrase/recombinase XerC
VSAAIAELARLGLTAADVARLNRELVKDKSYQLLPLGQEAAAYLRTKRKRLTESSFRDYEAGLDKFARFFPDLELRDLEPPVGTRRIEEFLDAQYGHQAPRTYNKNLSILRDFFKHMALRGEMHGDPTLAVERARARDVYRTTFNNDQRRAILAAQEDRRDRIALRLLLDYGLRKGALRAVQIKHFDHWRKRLTIFTKGQKVREVPIPDPAFWTDLEQYVLEAQSKPADFLMCRQRTIPVGKPDANGRRQVQQRRFPDKAMSDHGLHKWWYRCLANAGVVPQGVQSGERMHKARHTAGQRVLDATGNLKAVQKLLGHASISTTGDIYADWDAEQLAATMAQVLAADDEP